MDSLSQFSDVLDVSIETMLAGKFAKNKAETGNLKRLKFFVCPNRQSFLSGAGQAHVFCCGKRLTALDPKAPDAAHALTREEIDGEYYLTLPQEMTKAHSISFIAQIAFDRVTTVKLYPEQACAARFWRYPKARYVYYCTDHGLFDGKFWPSARLLRIDRSSPVLFMPAGWFP